MNNEKTTPVTPANGKKPMKDNPVAAFLAKSSIVARKELPVVFDGVMAMAIITILTGIQWISVEFTAVLVLLTIAQIFFRAGMVWQALSRK